MTEHEHHRVPEAVGAALDLDLMALLSTTQGVEDLAPADMGMFRRNGLYHQPSSGGFLLRLKVPGGMLRANQLRAIADIAERWAHGHLCLTTRQDIQVHRVAFADIRVALEAVAAIGLTTMNACGDTTRNVITCALQGVCPHEVTDVRPLVEALSRDPWLRDQRRALPRKNKISVAGCNRACGMTLINCHGWHPVARAAADGGTETGWRYYGGGGLGARPMLGRPVFDFVPFAMPLDVTRAATEVFNRLGDRENRARARIKFLVHDMGVQAYGEKVLGVLREWGIAGVEAIVPAQSPADIAPAFIDGQNVIPQHQPGYSVVRVRMPRGELTSSQAIELADIADSFADGAVRLTDRQNLLFRFIPEGRAPVVLDELRGKGYATDGFERAVDIVACIGCRQCPQGHADTVGAARAIADDLAQDERLVAEIGRLRIHINGCHNACAHHWMADIGLRGYTAQENGHTHAGFVIHLGGDHIGEGVIARDVGRCEVGQTSSEVRRVLDEYLRSRVAAEESFADYVRRTVGAESSRRGP